MRIELASACLALTVAVTALPRVAAGADIVVSPGQSIQAAIVAASSGDRILVQPGTYAEVIDYLGKTIEVIGVGGAAVTILDGTGLGLSVVSFTGGEPPAARLVGLTIRGGSGTPVSGNPAVRRGGGILASNLAAPTIRDCAIRDNSATEGGGVWASATGGAAALLERCVIVGNSADVGGGVVGARLRACVVRLNQAAVRGGGSANALEALDCLFANNGAAIDGGGSYVDLSAGATLGYGRLRFSGNTAARGGGVYWLGNGNLTGVANAVFVGNAATVEGGGVVVHNGGAFLGGAAAITSCSFAGNTAPVGAAALLRPFGTSAELSSALIDHCSSAGDQIAVPTPLMVTVSNSILWGNPTPVASPLSPIYLYSDVPAGILGVNLIHADPLFANVAAGDLHLTAGSPCIGTANANFPNTVDFEGDARGAVHDMGADEFAPHMYVSGTPLAGQPIILGIVGAPGSVPLVFLSATLATTPVPTPFGAFALGAPLLPGGPVLGPPLDATGVRLIPATIPAFSPTPAQLHLQTFLTAPQNQLTNPVTLLIDG